MKSIRYIVFSVTYSDTWFIKRNVNLARSFSNKTDPASRQKLRFKIKKSRTLESKILRIVFVIKKNNNIFVIMVHRSPPHTTNQLTCWQDIQDPCDWGFKKEVDPLWLTNTSGLINKHSFALPLRIHTLVAAG